MPLEKTVDTTKISTGQIHIEKERLYLKYTASSKRSKTKVSKRQHNIPLEAYVPRSGYQLENSYLTYVNVGTPPQRILAQIDTGSADLWIANTRCRSCNTSALGLFDEDSSKTWSSTDSTAQIIYGLGAVQADLGTDTVKLGSVELQEFLFGSVADQYDVTYPSSSGVLGMAFSFASNFGNRTFVSESFMRGVIDEPVFALKLGNYINDSKHEKIHSNELTIGGYDNKAFTGSINWIPGISLLFWEVPLDGIIVGRYALQADSYVPAILDSGTTLAYGPPRQVKELYSLFPEIDTLEDLYVFPCHSIPDVSFVINGQIYSIQKSDLIIDVTRDDFGREVCVGSIQPIVLAQDSNEAVWLLGDVFLKSVYSIYDLKENKIGLAHPSNNAAVNGQYQKIGSNDIGTAANREKGGKATFIPNPTATHSNRILTLPSGVPTNYLNPTDPEVTEAKYSIIRGTSISSFSASKFPGESFPSRTRSRSGTFPTKSDSDNEKETDSSTSHATCITPNFQSYILITIIILFNWYK